METLRVFSLKEAAEWKHWFEMLPDRYKDPFYTPEYLAAHQYTEKLSPICIVYQLDDRFAMYPFLMGCVNDLGYELNRSYFDIQGPYGYNGVVANSFDVEFLSLFKNRFLQWCVDECVIAEFVRYNPVSGNQNFSLWLEPLFLMENVLIPLDNYEDVWRNSYHKKVRKAVRKANRKGLKYISFDGKSISNEYFNEFVAIYYHMLDRNNADTSYYFSKDFLRYIKDNLADHSLFSFALLDEKPISTELTLIGKSNAYGFLGGTLSDFYEYSPNSYIQDEIVKNLILKGVNKYNRGGGIRNEDAIYRFKKSFSLSYESKFYIGSKIHNEEIYSEIVTQWESKSGTEVEKYAGRLLKYRY
jgi:serine/alanine adding enzyme